MCHYVSYCVPVTHMLINADLCLIMLIYDGATGVLLTDCCRKRVVSIKRHNVSSICSPCPFSGSSFVPLIEFLFFFFSVL